MVMAPTTPAQLALREFRRCAPAAEVIAALGGVDVASQAAFARLVAEDEVVARCPPCVAYQHRLYSALVAAAERAGVFELDDGLCELLAAAAVSPGGGGDDDCSHVSVDDGRGGVVSLRTFDRRNEVGLRLWPAALLFAEWTLAAPERFRGSAALEVGAGVGLCGLLLATAAGARRVVLTDGDPRVVTNLRHNCDLNGFPDGGGDATCAVDDFDWAESAAFFGRHGAFDVVVAADCVYDAAVAPALAEALAGALDADAAAEVWLANAVRNDDTWRATLAALEARGLGAVDCAGDAATAVVDARGGPRVVSPRVWAGLKADVARGALRLIRIGRGEAPGGT